MLWAESSNIKEHDLHPILTISIQENFINQKRRFTHSESETFTLLIGRNALLPLVGINVL